ncbi:MAG: hypothetical protein ACRDOO_23580 [Actinomadura sp.]
MAAAHHPPPGDYRPSLTELTPHAGNGTTSVLVWASITGLWLVFAAPLWTAAASLDYEAIGRGVWEYESIQTDLPWAPYLVLVLLFSDSGDQYFSLFSYGTLSVALDGALIVLAIVCAVQLQRIRPVPKVWSRRS